ncbi:HopJ type III effector protein [Aurantivibrio plasticivorans]
MTIDDLLNTVRSKPESVEFTQVMDVIENNYSYTPTSFHNGELRNDAGTNEGSCKIFYFAQLNNLSEMETLALFGHYYRDDVMGNPGGDDHGNIRNFILDGWLGIRFEGEALTPKV